MSLPEIPPHPLCESLGLYRERRGPYMISLVRMPVGMPDGFYEIAVYETVVDGEVGEAKMLAMWVNLTDDEASHILDKVPRADC